MSRHEDDGHRSTATHGGRHGSAPATRSVVGPRPDGLTAPSVNLSLRVSEADRDVVVDALRTHAAAGRIDIDELDERVTAALAARTEGDLAIITNDLPALPVARATADAAQPSRHGDRGEEAEHDGHGWGAYAAVMTLLVVIWLVSGAGHPWPLYPALGWGIPLLLASRRSGCGAPALRGGSR